METLTLTTPEVTTPKTTTDYKVILLLDLEGAQLSRLTVQSPLLLVRISLCR